LHNWFSSQNSAQAPGQLERLWTVFTVVVVMGWVFPLEANNPSGSAGAKIAYGGVFLVIGLLLLYRRRRALAMAVRSPLIWFVVFLACISILWSTAPWVTFVRSLALVGTTLTGLYLVATYPPREWLVLVALAFAVTICASLVVAAMDPTQGLLSGGAGQIRGVFSHKNVLGRVIALSVPIWLVLLPIVRSGQRWLPWVFVLTGSVVLALSNCKTALIAAAGVTLVWLVYALFRAHTYRFVAVVSGLLVLVVIAFGLFDLMPTVTTPTPQDSSEEGPMQAVFEAVGRDSGLTGRVFLWGLLWRQFERARWLGYGYGGFWLGWDGPASEVWAVYPTWRPVHAHNGYLDVALELGVVGLVLVGFLLLHCLYSTVRFALLGPFPEGWLPLAVLVMLLIINIADTSLLQRGYISWLTLSATVFWVNHGGARSTRRREGLAGDLQVWPDALPRDSDRDRLGYD